jgi:serine O-acetyltransferase
MFTPKNKLLLNVIIIFQGLRAFLHFFLYFTSPSKKTIEKDIERWLEILEEGDFNQTTFKPKALAWLLWKYPEYRNLFYYRIQSEKRLHRRVLMEISKLFFKPMDGLFIRAGEIGEGLFIQHGYATGISAKKMGKNCWVNQHVVIGYSKAGEAPIIGDNVHITAGAKVFGAITIGDNSIIGANAVVTKNVPPDCTVVGIPAYIIKRAGKKVKEPL